MSSRSLRYHVRASPENNSGASAKSCCFVSPAVLLLSESLCKKSTTPKYPSNIRFYRHISRQPIRSSLTSHPKTPLWEFNAPTSRGTTDSNTGESQAPRTFMRFLRYTRRQFSVSLRASDRPITPQHQRANLPPLPCDKYLTPCLSAQSSGCKFHVADLFFDFIKVNRRHPPQPTGHVRQPC